MRTLHFRALVAASLFVLAAAPGRAEDAPTKRWSNVGEFSLVSTNGNSKGTTTSAKDTFKYTWSRAALELIGGGLGASDRDGVSAEQYNASEKVTFPLSTNGKNYLYEKYAWDSNRFAGFRNRHDASAGIGRQLVQRSSHTWIGEFGGGYINEERINAPRNDFASGRAYTKYVYALSATGKFSQDAEYLHNFDQIDDYRFNTETALVASMSTHLALKASYTWKRVGMPPPGIGKDDTITSAALIINY